MKIKQWQEMNIKLAMVIDWEQWTVEDLEVLNGNWFPLLGRRAGRRCSHMAIVRSLVFMLTLIIMIKDLIWWRVLKLKQNKKKRVIAFRFLNFNNITNKSIVFISFLQMIDNNLLFNFLFKYYIYNIIMTPFIEIFVYNKKVYSY